jgi:protein O-GlcNAc transferase
VFQEDERMNTPDLTLGFERWRQGDLRGARAIFEPALAGPDAPAQAFAGIGSVLWSEGRFEDALAAFQEAARRDPWTASHWSNIGLALRDLGRPLHAVHVFQVAVTLDPGYAAAYNEWGNVLQDQGLYDEALRLYERSLALDASRPVVHHNLGVCHLRRGEGFVAESCFRTALKLDPDYHHSLEELGRLMRDRGRSAEAARYLRAAGTPRAQAILTELGVMG